MIQRNAAETLVKLADQFKAVVVTGPRQSGKTTLVRAVFTEKRYVNLENPDTRRFAMDDPRGFLSQYKNASIIGAGRVVFNIKGNDYRLVVAIDYEFQVIFIRFIGTHKQYDEINAKTI